MVKEALESGRISQLVGYSQIRAEVPYGTNSRIDFLARGKGLPDTYIEVKNVHLLRSEDWAEFPDSVTARGAKHLGELMRVVDEGARAVMLYLVQRTDCTRFRLAGDIDPAYATAFDAARSAGVEMLCYGTEISVEGVRLAGELPVDEALQSP